jgi:nitrite reductase (NO-forming)
MKRATAVIAAFALPLFVVAPGSPGPAIGADSGTAASHRHTAQTRPTAPTQAPAKPTVSKKSPAAEYTPTVRYRLRTELAEGKMAFVGVGGAIEGVVNPTLRVNTTAMSCR